MLRANPEETSDEEHLGDDALVDEWWIQGESLISGVLHETQEVTPCAEASDSVR
jgi:hypothetical protein